MPDVACAMSAETEAVVDRLVRQLAKLLDTSSDMDELDPAGPADMALVRLTSSEALLRLARLHDSRIHPEVYMLLALTMQVCVQSPAAPLLMVLISGVCALPCTSHQMLDVSLP